MIEDSSKEDIRLVYLALHHIIKYRGNFLYNGNFNVSNLNVNYKLKEVFNMLFEEASELNISEDILNQLDYSDIEKIIMDISKNDIKNNLKNKLNCFTGNKFASEFGKLIVGNKFSIKDLLNIDTDNKLSISFDGTDYDDKYGELEDLLGDEIGVIEALKELYDMVFLKKIFKKSNNPSISDLMVERYNQHGKDLRLLKDLFGVDRKKYNEIFRNREATKSIKEYTCLYELYVHNKLSYDDFRKKIEAYISELFEQIGDMAIIDRYNDVKFRISNGEFLPKVTDAENGKYPYQLNENELIKIIENQGQYYPFLLNKINNEYKIVKLLNFRIPYYVGPLNSNSKFSWLTRNDNVKITPYNFDEVVDKESTAEEFIKRMISHCTYILSEYALPNNGILYDKFKVMNELKQIRINGNKIENKLQKKIIEELFMKSDGSITDKKFKEYIHSSKEFDMYENDLNITGYSADGKFANNMQSYIDFFGENGIFKDTSYNEENAEEIIEWITIFEDKDILKEKVRKSYPELNDVQIKKILSKKYKGWGSLSKKLLSGIYYKDKETGLNKTIMDLMSETDENFMQIINNDEYNFQERINEENEISEDTKLNYKLVEDLATSPATKRGIYQSLKVVEELIKYMGYKPKSVMIEMSREDGKKKERKDDRKKYLQKLYKAIKEETREHNDEIGKLERQLNDIEKIDSEKLFLYFIQEGKCLYCGKPLNIEDLNSYEVDHILPRSIIKDDSIDNKALVYRECNQNKGASLVLPNEYRANYMKKWWEHLKKVKLISASKFYRLTRAEYKDEDIQGFINRQLVETRQITKHVANIIGNLYDTKVVYLKANLSHNYRLRYELYKFRDLNDYHHAFDAYLAAILGEYKEKYMKKNINYDMVKELNTKLIETKDYKKLNYGFVINSLDNEFSDVVNKITGNLIDQETGEILFDADEFNKQAEDTYYRNDVLISRKTEIRSGQFYDQNMIKKGVNGVPSKNNMPTERYGGYSKVCTSYLVLVSYKNKQKLIAIPLEIVAKSKKDKNVLKNYIRNHLNLKNDEKLEILKEKIPFESQIDIKGHLVYIKGYSISHKDCEVSNAKQLRIEKTLCRRWKYVLNNVLNNKEIYDGGIEISELVKRNLAIEIIEYLFNIKDSFPLFVNSVLKIEENIDLNNLSYDELSKIIIELFKLYHCNSVNANLKQFGLGDAIGRCRTSIDGGKFTFKSVTGLRETTYEF